MLNKFIGYFDINSKFRSRFPEAKSGSNTELHWLPQWAALILGVWLAPYFEYYRVQGQWSFDGSWGRLLFSIITAVILFPGVYKKVISKDAPLLVLLAPCFVAGLGYEALLKTAIHLAK